MTAKLLSVGSTGGLLAAKRGECDIAGIHLMDPSTGVYNRAYIDDHCTWFAAMAACKVSCIAGTTTGSPA